MQQFLLFALIVTRRKKHTPPKVRNQDTVEREKEKQQGKPRKGQERNHMSKTKDGGGRHGRVSKTPESRAGDRGRRQARQDRHRYMRHRTQRRACWQTQRRGQSVARMLARHVRNKIISLVYSFQYFQLAPVPATTISECSRTMSCPLRSMPSVLVTILTCLPACACVHHLQLQLLFEMVCFFTRASTPTASVSDVAHRPFS